MTDVISKAVNKGIIIIILVLLILVLIFAFLLKTSQSQEVIITTDKTEYGLNEVLTITVKNNLTDSICLSPCSLGLLEKKNGQWEIYDYEECKKPDECLERIEPKQAKSFEFDIYATEPGLHRMVLPSCINCQLGDDFREDERFYSNEFTISR